MEKKKVEAATLQRKKTTINKAKIKKTIKNTLCRPDPVFWPNVGEDQASVLETALARHKVEIPEFKKPHWREVKSIPQDQRPKQPKIKKVEGLIFGISQCNDALKSSQCAAVIIESTVNPRAIVQPLIEACLLKKVPVVCLNDLRKTTSLNFGIPTSCLAVKSGFLQELGSKIEEIAKQYKVPKLLREKANEKVELKFNNTQNIMEVDVNEQEISSLPSKFTYLYRNNKSTRVFDPSSQQEPKPNKAFIGQDFIEFSEKPEQKSSDRKAYMSMILKRMTSNQNRTKKKKKTFHNEIKFIIITIFIKY